MINFEKFGPVPDDTADDYSSISQIRSEYDLTKAGAARLLDVPVEEYDAWESSGIFPRTSDELHAAFARSTVAAPQGRGANIIFDHYPLRFAREALKLSIEEIAAKYDYSVHTWRSFERNARVAPRLLLESVEDLVRAELLKICS